MDDYHRHERQGCDGDAVAEFVNPGMKGDSQVPDTVRKRRNIEIHIFVNLEAPPGFEPGMEVLQTSALPLGDGAGRNQLGRYAAQPQDSVFAVQPHHGLARGARQETLPNQPSVTTFISCGSRDAQAWLVVNVRPQMILRSTALAEAGIEGPRSGSPTVAHGGEDA